MACSGHNTPYAHIVAGLHYTKVMHGLYTHAHTYTHNTPKMHMDTDKEEGSG